MDLLRARKTPPFHFETSGAVISNSCRLGELPLSDLQKVHSLTRDGRNKGCNPTASLIVACQIRMCPWNSILHCECY